MKRRIGTMNVLAVLLMLALARQSAPAPPPASAGAAEVEALVRAWFDKWNQLDGRQESVDAWVQLYEPDALHTAGPESHQKGTVTFKGHDGLRALAAMTVATTERPAEEGSNPVRFCLLPWALCLGKVT